MRQGFNADRMVEREDLLRAEIAETLTSVCHIWSPVRTPDGVGGFASVSVLIGNDVPCAINVHTPGSEDVVASQVKGQTLYVVHLPPGQTISIDDHITFDGLTYRVVELDYSVSVEIARTVYAVVNK